MKKLLLVLVCFTLTYGMQAQCGPGQDTTSPVFEGPGDGTMSNPFRNLLQTTVGSVPSGRYYFNFNGATFQGELDNDTDGGGWLMILNYVHLAGDNSTLQVRNTDLPLLSSSTLEDNEAGTENWGHMGNALAADIDFEEMRFYGVTTGHNRVIDFTTSYTNAINYVKTGTGSFNRIEQSNFTALPNHTANIPAQAVNEFTNQGDLALTEFPFWRGGQFHWGIRGLGNRWEVDDFANNTQSTIHRVWVRGDLSPTATTTITVNLDQTGNITVAPQDFGINATDNCSTPNLSLSQTDFDCSHIGNNMVQLMATDDQNNSTSIDVTVIVNESAPVITNDQIVNVDLDASGNVSITLADLNASATDDCGLQSLTLSRTDFDCSHIGGWTVTITATDINDNISTSDVIVVINDVTDPIMQCVAPFTIELDDTGNASIEVANILESISDNCNDFSYSLDKTTFSCADIGENTITLTVRDAGRNSVSCTTIVTVTVPSCPSNLVLDADPDTCGAVYNYPCSSNLTEGPASGTLLPVGSTTTFTYDTLDNTGATVSCSYDVTVVDNLAPLFNTEDQAITLNPGETVTIPANDFIGPNPFAVDYTLDTTGTFDRVDISASGTEITLGDDELSAALPIGFEFGFYGNLYTELYIASNGLITFSDEGEDGCCSGQSLPDAGTPNNLIAFDWTDLNPSYGGTIRYVTTGTAPNRIAIIDFDDIRYYDNDTQGTTSQIKLFEGTNRIEIHGTSTFDSGGGVKTQGIENSDGTAAIIVPGRNGDSATWSTTNDYVAFVPVSSVFENCGVDTVVVTPDTFDCTNIGDNIVTLTITDIYGNSASETAVVRVETTDTTAPIISLTGADPQIIELGSGYIELGATTDDGSAVTIDTSDFVDALGSYTIRYNATDDSCNDAIEVTRTVNVVDTTAPIITLVGDNPQVIELGSGYTELGATTDDGTTVVIDTSAFVDSVGNYTITYNATDSSGNMAIEVTRTVNVVDTTAPVITLVGDNPQTIELGSGYTELGATTDDGTAVVIDTSAFVDALGSYSVTYNATDASGNIATEVTRTVHVVDTTAPIITLIGDNPQTIELGSGYTELGATTDDGTAVVIDTSAFVDTLGNYSITYNATDASGNIATEVTRTVHVVDTTAPIITLIGDNPQTIGIGEGYTELGATTDDGSILVIDTSAFVDALGSYPITYNATDASGNNAIEVIRIVNVIERCPLENLPFNNFQLQALSETCTDKNNGIITIDTMESQNYTATINNQDYPFTSNLVVNDLPPGTYPVCVAIDGFPDCEQCFELVIEEAAILNGSTSIDNNNTTNQMFVQIDSGTAPYTVIINEEVIGEYDTNNFTIPVQNGDVVEIVSSLACEGKLSKTIEGFKEVSLYPNPTKANVTVTLPGINSDAIAINIHNTLGILVSSKMYPISGGKVALPMEDLAAGVYFININDGTSKVYRIIKE